MTPVPSLAAALWRSVGSDFCGAVLTEWRGPQTAERTVNHSGPWILLGTYWKTILIPDRIQ